LTISGVAPEVRSSPTTFSSKPSGGSCCGAG
jgi:hypothetical protein